MFGGKQTYTNLCDIHCHVLPGLDDGADSLETAVAMCRQAAEEGIATVVATPHFNDRYQPSDDAVNNALGDLRAAIADLGLRLELLLGADVAVSPGLKELVSSRPSLTFEGKGKYMLLEPPAQFMPEWLNEVVFDLRIEGINVIITHPERNAEVIDDPNVIIPLVQSGVLVQVTADSLAGTFGPEIRRCAVSLLRMNAVHFIATDAHSAQFRSPCLREAIRVATRYLGDDAVRLTRENPLAAIRGDEVVVPDPEPIRRWFGRMTAAH